MTATERNELVSAKHPRTGLNELSTDALINVIGDAFVEFNRRVAKYHSSWSTACMADAQRKVIWWAGRIANGYKHQQKMAAKEAGAVKVCTKCGTSQPLKHFRRLSSQNRYQRHSWCKTCFGKPE